MVEYLHLGRDDEAFEALLMFPWINSQDQFSFFLTMKNFLPKARLAIRHFIADIELEGEKMIVKGFRILVNGGSIHFATHAIMLTEKICAQT